LHSLTNSILYKHTYSHHSQQMKNVASLKFSRSERKIVERMEENRSISGSVLILTLTLLLTLILILIMITIMIPDIHSVTIHPFALEVVMPVVMVMVTMAKVLILVVIMDSTFLKLFP